MKKAFLISLVYLLAFSLGSYCQSAAVINGLALKYMVHMPATKTPKPPVVILLHGYGSNEKDLFELRSFFPANYLVVSARAPYNVNGGGYQWFEKEIVNGKYTGVQQHLDNSRKSILKFISQIVARYKADAASVYVAGFSQGAMMCYEVGLTSPHSVKGIAVLSGRMPESLQPEVKQTPALSKLQIFIAHGTADTRLPFADGKAANDFLVSKGLKPDFHAYKGMEHSISNEVMTDLVKWMK